MSDAPSERLEWNEENFAQVVADLYREAETDQALHERLLANPYEVLSGRITVPESYRGGMFAREKGQDIMMLYVPAFGVARAALPEGTSDSEAKPDFEPICTVETLW